MNYLENVFKNINKDLEWIKDRTIFITLYGSHAYGLETPESDIDLRGICIPTAEYFTGFNKEFHEYIINDPDCTIFNIKKFFKLASSGNPNTLELLFVDPSDIVHIDKLGEEILANRDHFLSKQLKERYIGFAKSQFHRILRHRKWLLSPVVNKPTRQEMGLPDRPQIDKNQFDCIKSIINAKLATWNCDFEPFTDSQKIYLQGKVSEILSEMHITSNEQWLSAARSIGLSDNYIQIIKQEKEYENRVDDWKHYQEWKQNRNPKRAILEEKCGYDAKHATQLYRLLKVGKEILETRKVQVKRLYDREELLRIKRGEESYEKLIDQIEKMENEIKIAYQNSKLSNQPNIKLLDNLCVKLIEKSLYG